VRTRARRGAAGGSRGGDGSRTGLDLRAEPVVPDAIDVSWLDHEADAGLWDILCRLEDFLRSDPFVLHLADSLGRSCLHLLLNAPAGELDWAGRRPRCTASTTVAAAPCERRWKSSRQRRSRRAPKRSDLKFSA
jgi:hypothetical protein